MLSKRDRDAAAVITIAMSNAALRSATFLALTCRSPLAGGVRLPPLTSQQLKQDPSHPNSRGLIVTVVSGRPASRRSVRTVGLRPSASGQQPSHGLAGLREIRGQARKGR